MIFFLIWMPCLHIGVKWRKFYSFLVVIYLVGLWESLAIARDLKFYISVIFTADWFVLGANFVSEDDNID